MGREHLLLRYWRSLFHARVHLAFDERPDLVPPLRRTGSTTGSHGSAGSHSPRPARCSSRTLTSSCPADNRSTYVEFAAAYLELLAFHPAILPHTFPAIEDHDAVVSLLAEDVEIDALLEATRLPGCTCIGIGGGYLEQTQPAARPTRRR